MDQKQKRTEEQLRRDLGDAAYHVTREEGTEAPFSHPYDRIFEEGIYVDVITKEVLFLSKDKFQSGCGWPSFSRTAPDAPVEEKTDLRYGMRRTEVRTESTHLGHVFEDGPADRGGLRYCINGLSLEFIPKAEMEARGYGKWIPYL
ncbi:Peptide methionine sulfoxide reductase MsrA/MsrB 1 [Aedoeadaptatus ivorii]|uniref:peptide-methionine (R)-S-oxide reductase n=1 Tax=Aedoeadaptatus ivorii TaxID=54006 RepID=A0A448V228_9FIRM|nr:peptide-methionine (R)-S-oxide reductase MsrB [Peptoniphilus ivorii]VEJ35880.1 Peptide methionine sulfoxide reductase MsrA/MsrB 1 [Peptoniphilus ivorii]